jgi:hypothetical protein
LSLPSDVAPLGQTPSRLLTPRTSLVQLIHGCGNTCFAQKRQELL